MLHDRPFYELEGEVYEQRRNNSCPVEARAAGKSHAGYSPQACGSGKSLDAEALFDYSTCAQEAYAADHLRTKACWVNVHHAHVFSAHIFRRDSHKGGADADKHMGAYARRTIDVLTLVAYEAAQQGRHTEP